MYRMLSLGLAILNRGVVEIFELIAEGGKEVGHGNKQREQLVQKP